MRAFDLSESAVKKMIKAFISYGVDGLVAKKRPGRRPLIPAAQKEEIWKSSSSWVVRKKLFGNAFPFHGHIADKYCVECSYETVHRLLHEKGYGPKVPQPWPDRQDEKAHEEFVSNVITGNLEIANVGAHSTLVAWSQAFSVVPLVMRSRLGDY